MARIRDLVGTALSFLNTADANKTQSNGRDGHQKLAQIITVHVPNHEYNNEEFHYIIPKDHLLAKVVFPAPISDDKWEVYRHQRMIEGFIKMFTKHKWFDVSKVDELVDFYKIAHLVKRQGSDSPYQKLRILHCVNWADMPPDIRVEVPDLLNEIFALTNPHNTLETED